MDYTPSQWIEFVAWAIIFLCFLSAIIVALAQFGRADCDRRMARRHRQRMANIKRSQQYFNARYGRW